MKIIRELDFSRCRLVPMPDGTMSGVKAHVKYGVRCIVANPYFFLTDEMGGMKSAQAIISAEFLREFEVINKVIVLAPASVRPVWFDPELGELAKHLWFDQRNPITEYHARERSWIHEIKSETRGLQWIISNYEFIRSGDRIDKLLALADEETFLICDESSALKNPKAVQFKAALELRKKCGRVLQLNGTPIANTPMDLFAQGELMDLEILAAPSPTFPKRPIRKYNFYNFRARYAILGGWQNKQIIKFQNLEDLQERFKPYTLRRLKKDCLDLPEALPPVALAVPLKEETWKIYKQMRDEMVAWISTNTVAAASQAAVKTMRLAQITSGFLGGLEEAPERQLDFTGGPEDDIPENRAIALTQEIGREKLDFLFELYKDWIIADPNLKLLVWCIFIPELERLLKEYRAKYPKTNIGCCAGPSLLGKGKKIEREEVLRLLDPRTAPSGPVFVGGTSGTGGLGHNFTACHTVVNMSFDYSYFKAEQAAARVDRPGQVVPVSTFDLVATGPQGQKTTDHIRIKARRNKAEVAQWTASDWIHAIMEE